MHVVNGQDRCRERVSRKWHGCTVHSSTEDLRAHLILISTAFNMLIKRHHNELPPHWPAHRRTCDPFHIRDHITSPSTNFKLNLNDLFDSLFVQLFILPSRFPV